PEGTATINHKGVINSSSNILWVDKDFKAIGWAMVDEGTTDKYSGSGNFSNTTHTPPANAVYFVASTTSGTINNNTAIVVANGVFTEKAEQVNKHTCIYELNADTLANQVRSVSDLTINKGKVGVSALEDITVVDRRDLANVDEYMTTGGLVIPTGVLNSQ